MKLPAILFTALFTASLSAAQSQSEAVPWLIAQGTTSLQAGAFREAESHFRAVLALEPRNTVAIYSLARTLALSNRPQAALDLAENGVEIASPERGLLYELIATTRERQGDARGAIAAFKRGLRVAEGEPALYYSYGMALARRNDLTAARAQFKRAIALRPSHAPSHIALARTFAAQGYRVPAALAFARALALERSGADSAEAAASLLALLQAGVTRESGGTNLTITVDPRSKKDEGDFASLELMMAMATASQLTEEASRKSDAEKGAAIVSTWLAFMNESPDPSWPKSFAGKEYAEYFVQMAAAGLGETFGYAALAALELGESSEWLTANADSVARLDAWVEQRSASSR